MTLILKPGTSWSETYSKCVSAAPEAFGPDHLRNLTRGQWSDTGREVPHLSPIDGSPMVGPSVVDARFAVEAVEYAGGPSGLEPRSTRRAARAGERSASALGRRA